MSSLSSTGVVIPTKRRKGAFAWEYMVKKEDNQVHCTLCEQVYSAGTSTSVLEIHLARHHYLFRTKGPDPIRVQTTIGFRPRMTPSESKKARDLLVQWQLCGNIPVNAFQHPTYKEFA